MCEFLHAWKRIWLKAITNFREVNNIFTHRLPLPPLASLASSSCDDAAFATIFKERWLRVAWLMISTQTWNFESFICDASWEFFVCVYKRGLPDNEYKLKIYSTHIGTQGFLLRGFSRLKNESEFWVSVSWSIIVFNVSCQNCYKSDNLACTKFLIDDKCKESGGMF